MDEAVERVDAGGGGGLGPPHTHRKTPFPADSFPPPATRPTDDGSGRYTRPALAGRDYKEPPPSQGAATVPLAECNG